MEAEEWVDSYLRRAVTLNRVSEYEAARVTNKLRRLNLGLEVVIEEQGEKLTQARVTRLGNQIDAAINHTYAEELLPELDKITSQVGTREAAWNLSTMRGVGDEMTAIYAPDLEGIVNTAKLRPYQGRTFAQWYGDAAATQKARLSAALTSAWVEQMAVEELMKVVSAILTRSENDVRTLTRSYIQHVAIEARDEVLAANDDFHDGVVWSATLDHRTTPLICGVRDMLEYDKKREPIDHDYAWGEGPGRIHFNCRSIHIPRIKGLSFTGMRPAVNAGKNYESGDNKNQRGRVARPDKSRRDKGIFRVNRVSVETTYEKWLRRQPQDFIADVLNSKKKATAFKEGESLSSFLPKTGPGSLGSITNQSVLKL